MILDNVDCFDLKKTLEVMIVFIYSKENNLPQDMLYEEIAALIILQDDISVHYNKLWGICWNSSSNWNIQFKDITQQNRFNAISRMVTTLWNTKISQKNNTVSVDIQNLFKNS